MIVRSTSNIDLIQGVVGYGDPEGITDWRITNTSGTFNILNSISQTSKLTILESGNVGISNINPGSLLDIGGDVNISGVYKRNNRDVINDTSNYVLSTSNILVPRILTEVGFGSNYTSRLNTALNTRVDNTSNYVLATSNVLVNRVSSQWTNVYSGINYTPVAQTITNIITSSPVAPITGTTGVYTYQVFTYTTETAGAGTRQTQYTINVPTGGVVCDILMVGGGGAGGRDIGAGGGGGAVLYGTNISIASGTYEIRVGDGAVAGETRGKSTTGFGATLLGGGCAVNAAFGTTNTTANGNSGGSGGGGRGVQSGFTGGIGGTVGISTKGTILNTSTLYNGNIGGNGQAQAAGVSCGGGGGAGSVGGNGYDTKSGGNGGDGVPINITDTQYYWGSGGGAGCHEGIPGNGGLGGGGAGSVDRAGVYFTGNVGGSGYGIASGKHAGAGTGSGGGGVRYNDTVGGNGGSGIVIIRYISSTFVGIGTATPATELHVYDDTSINTVVTVQNNFSGTMPTLPTEIVSYAGTTSGIIGTSERYISFPYLTGTGTFTTWVFTTTEVLDCDILVVGGGGGGGSRHAGGGGAGAVIYLTNQNLSTGEYVIRVGNGGTGATTMGQGNKGVDSSITFNSTAIYLAKGGGSGNHWSTTGNSNKDGGSGGGGGDYVGNAVSDNIPAGTYGNSGGLLISYNGGGGGGGGALTSGTNGTNTIGGSGGNGKTITITGSSIVYGGGGGGGSLSGYVAGTGGTGGGGPGSSGPATATNGTDGRGGGGGGGGFWESSNGAGGRGGTGIVIIRYRRTTSAALELISRGLLSEVPIPGTTITTVSGTFDRCILFTYTGDSVGLTGQTQYTFRTTEALTCDILVVGGGGSGGYFGGGGGGGGDVIYQQNILFPVGSYNIVVGAGGTKLIINSQAAGNNGYNSSISGTGISTITAAGGGGGAGYAAYALTVPSIGTSSGGGGGASGNPPYTTGAVSQYSGAGGNGVSSFLTPGGGGGGSVGAGGTSTVKSKAGNGGIGNDISITGVSQQYGGGGGGGNWAGEFSYTDPNIGGGTGVYGGGNGHYNNNYNYISGTDGTPNTGGGGGGSNNDGRGKGGSGVVIIRYRRAIDNKQNYKVGNYGSDFKIISSTQSADTDFIKITSSGASIYNPTGSPQWSTTSDRRIKENIEKASYTKCYDSINKLELYRFNYIKDFNNINKDQRQLGYIAQEVQEIFPKAVSAEQFYNNNLCIPDLLTIDIAQINYSLYGAVKKLIEIDNNKEVRLKKLEYLLNIESASNNVIINDTSNVIIADTSNVIINDTSNVIINDTSNLIINDTSNLIINDTSNIIITDTSNIIITDSSNIIITDTSNVIITDTSNIIITDISNIIIADTSNVIINDTSNVIITDTSNVIITEASTSNITQDAS
jgi:hypothetical protein